MTLQPKMALSILFLATIVCVPILQLVIEVRRGDRPGVLGIFDRKPTSVNLRAFERSLEDDNVLAKEMRPWVQFVQFQWLRDGGEKALVGRDGWLFYKPGFDRTVSRPIAHATLDPLPAILAFRDALAARSIRLIVMPVPNKESVYPDKLTRRASTIRSLPSQAAQTLLARLLATDVEVIDLFDLFARKRQSDAASDPPLYLTQDSHWSPVGVDCAAKAVSSYLLDHGLVGLGNVNYSENPIPVRRLGDVLRMLQVPFIERSTQPENVPCMQVVRSDNALAYQDDPASEILVMGDSFFRIYQNDEPGSAGFISHLAKELRQPLTLLVNDGGASTLVRQELFRRPRLLQNKKVVIWEFVERDIGLGTEGWQIVPLPPELR